MKTEHQASRTLVKSPPELWAECSDAALLARHIGEFGEIRITRLEPETAIDWEGELATGTVTIEPSGWGTRVTLTVQTEAEEAGQLEPAEEAAQSEPDGVVGAAAEPVETAAEPQITETEPVEEDADETMEATDAEPDLAVAADPDPVDRGWRRLIKRTRSWFKPREGEREPELESVAPPAAESVSIPPPDSSAPPAAVDEPEPEPVAIEMPVEPVPEPTAESEPSAEPEPTAEPVPSLDPDAILTAALDSLGQAHHRPFSRA